MKVYISAEDEHAEVSVNIEVKDTTRHAAASQVASSLDVPINLIESRQHLDERRNMLDLMLHNASRATLIALMGGTDD